ncbi:insulinase family protein [Nitrincola tapanii]|uniref:Protease 3 n=1 Tax=Nitrincola tapanii TaxID=1708751 RepID=A0A5A9W044_9GAMM|nr:insulinase family protein [Nitrincola tapanii]KAA0874117.1 peptidase M16 [Nitrincola tapanii]
MLNPKPLHFVFFLLLFWLTTSVSAETVNLIKSPQDPRDYASLTLPNQLRVLLISDPEAEKASASLDVRVGSGANPVDRPGLAHFLEHMLFLGTETFPEADSYQAFISANAGSHNAFTAYENTNYFFEVQPQALPEALQRFSRFFIDPLFSPEYVNRERHAVESEFQARRRDDRRRIHEVTKQVMNPEHGWSRFAVGDLASLSDRPESSIRDELIAFYETYYSANLMSLVIMGPQPLDRLQALAQEYFSPIENRQAEAYVDQAPLFVEGQLPKRLDMRTLRQMRELSLFFPLPAARPYWQEKPLNFLASLIGHEGERSLLSHLKQQGWATALRTSPAVDLENSSGLQIDISLTESGLQAWDRVTEQVFAFIQQLREQLPELEALYIEDQRLADLEFRFRDNPRSVHEVVMLAQMQHWIPVEQLLYANYFYSGFNPQSLEGFLAGMTPDNLLLTLQAQDLSTDQTEPRYNAAYSLLDLTSEELARWHHPQTAADLAIRSPNPFIPEDLALVTPTENPSELPVRLIAEEGFSLWHQQDQTFLRPRADLFVALMTHQALASAENTVMLDLYTRILNDQLNETLYEASLAGLNASIYPHLRGVSLQISGYHDKQAELLQHLIRAMQQPDINEERFQRVKVQLQERLINLRQEAPYQQGLQALYTALMTRWSSEDKLQALETLTPDQLQQFLPELYTELEVRMLAHGNLSAEAALSLGQSLKAELLAQTRPIQDVRVPVLRLPERTQEKQALSLLVESEHQDAALTLYLQGADKALRTRAAVALINEMISAPFYSELRTEKQFGYIVFSNLVPMVDVPGLALIVQSSVIDPSKLLAEYEDFLSRTLSRLRSLAPEELQAYQRSLSSRLLQPDATLHARSQRYWRELDRDGAFTTHLEIAAEVNTLTNEDLVLTLEQLLEHRLLIQSFGDLLGDKETRAADSAAQKSGKRLQALRSQGAFF